MVEESGLQQIFTLVEHGTWFQVLGAVLIAIVAAVRYLTRGRVKGGVEEWVSVSSALVGGVGSALLVGGPWYWALAVGVLVSPTSKGFWEKVRKSIPIVGCFLLLLFALSSTACAGQQVDTPSCLQSAIRAAADVMSSCMPRDTIGSCPVIEAHEDGPQPSEE